MNNEERAMYELEYPAPAVESSASKDGHAAGVTMIVALHGYADAGQAVEESADHLKAALESRLVASFNADELVDYRSRRPVVTIEDNSTPKVKNLDLEMRVLRDTEGRSFLLLSGPEPDLRWQGFTDAVASLVEKYNVDKTICLYAAPMPTPHTRPLVVTAHGNAASLVDSMFKMESKMMLPGAAQLYIERALAKAGRNVAGYTAHVPHYLAASSYPQATHGLLDAASSALGLDFPLRTLEHDIERFDVQLAEQVTDSDEIGQVVRQLEEQYDSYMERYREKHPQAIMPGERHVPSAEEISAEFEKFLDALDASALERENLLHEDIDDREDAVINAEEASTDRVDRADRADRADEAEHNADSESIAHGEISADGAEEASASDAPVDEASVDETSVDETAVEDSRSSDSRSSDSDSAE